MIKDLVKILNSESENDIIMGIEIAKQHLTEDELIILRKSLNPIELNKTFRSKDNWSWSSIHREKIYWKRSRKDLSKGRYIYL